MCSRPVAECKDEWSFRVRVTFEVTAIVVVKHVAKGAVLGWVYVVRRPSVVTTSSERAKVSLVGPMGVGASGPTPGPAWVGVVPVELSG